jgi:hypothetical protein
MNELSERGKFYIYYRGRYGFEDSRSTVVQGSYILIHSVVALST